MTAPAAERGFTLIEVLIAVLIAGILAVIAVPYNKQSIKAGAEKTAVTDIQNISWKLKAMILESPGALPEDQQRFVEYLQDAGLPVNDPWGRPYVYLRLFARPENENQARKDHNLHPINSYFDLYSMGPDGKSMKPLTGGPSQDDIICANDGAFIGKASSYTEDAIAEDPGKKEKTK